MPTERQRIEDLEGKVETLERMVGSIGSWPVPVLTAAIEQLVDERKLPAGTRNEISGRVRTGAEQLAVADQRLAVSARKSIPPVLTADDTERRAAAAREMRRAEARLDREVLKLPRSKPKG